MARMTVLVQMWDMHAALASLGIPHTAEPMCSVPCALRQAGRERVVWLCLQTGMLAWR